MSTIAVIIAVALGFGTAIIAVLAGGARGPGDCDYAGLCVIIRCMCVTCASDPASKTAAECGAGVLWIWHSEGVGWVRGSPEDSEKLHLALGIRD